MQNLNLSFPLFGRPAVPPLSSSEHVWNEVDTLDVELLAEYLLEDEETPGVSIDFNIDGAFQAMVSPENSEDGILPPVAETIERHPAHLAPEPFFTPTNVPPPGLPLSSFHTFTGIPGLPLPGPPPFGNTSAAPGIMVMDTTGATKRRRLEAPATAAPVLAVATSPFSLGVAPPRAKAQAQLARRRERNRILARRTRLRKKFFFEALQKEVMDLQKENEVLKGVVQDEIGGDQAAAILHDCDAMDKLPSSVLEACGEHANELEAQDVNLVRSIQQSQHSFVITDPSLADNPIVFASDDFLKLTGYQRGQVLGRNCRFLQGTDTCQDKVKKIRQALAVGEDVTVTMVNYTADGTPFWNKLFIASLRDAQANVVNFIGVCVKVAAPEPGDAEHGKYVPGLKNDLYEDEEDDDDDT